MDCHADVFSIAQTPKMKGIEEKQIFIYFDRNTIVDFVDLGMPKVTNPYENQLFKYIFVHEKSEYTRLEIIEFIKDIIANSH